MAAYRVQAALLLVSAATVLVLAVRRLLQRPAGARHVFFESAFDRQGGASLVLGSIAVWQAGQALEMLLPEHALPFHRLSYVGICLLPVGVLLSARRLTQTAWPRASFLFLVPLATLAINFTPGVAPLFWDQAGLQPWAGTQVLATIRGPWFPIHTGYSYLCLIVSIVLLLQHAAMARRHRRESLVTLGAVLLPFAANVLELTESFGQVIALTPLSLSGTAAAMVWLSLQDESSRRLLPTARIHVLEGLDDPVFVIDADGAILDLNRAGRMAIGAGEVESAVITLAGFGELECFLESGEGEGDLSFDGGGGLRHFHAVRSEIDSEGLVSAVVLRETTQLRAYQDRIHQLAYYDHLTGLPNRRLFQQRLNAAFTSAANSGTKVAVLVIDIDRFKYINDTFGHPAGDELLRRSAERCFDSIRLQDLVSSGLQASVSRIGGDEFIVLLTGLRRPSDAMMVAERLVGRFEEPFQLGEDEVFASLSVGIALYPEHGSRPDDLIALADRAMYGSKKSPGSAVRVYDPVSDDSHAEVRLETELRRALEYGEFELYYQPVFSADMKRLVGAEALCRWHHPDNRICGPAQFIEVAERSGLIVPLGHWVLEQAAEQVAKWRERVPEFRIAVNVSAVQVGERAFSEQLAEILDRRGLAGEGLELELTERVLLEDGEASAEQQLHALAALGVGLSLDDFGTGYSSLSYLHRLPFDTVKIDRSFVAGLGRSDAAVRLCRGIIEMAHGLGLDVVAEGVEDPPQLEILRALGCDRVQGFLIGHALPAAEMEALLEDSSARSALLEQATLR